MGLDAVNGSESENSQASSKPKTYLRWTDVTVVYETVPAHICWWKVVLLILYCFFSSYLVSVLFFDTQIRHLNQVPTLKSLWMRTGYALTSVFLQFGFNGLLLLMTRHCCNVDEARIISFLLLCNDNT
jgi:hypothetical protein